MNYPDREGTKIENRFVVQPVAPLAVYITMLNGEDMDFFAVGVFFVLHAVVIAEPLVN